MDPSERKPIFLLADSQLLFWRDGERRFLARVAAALDVDAGSATAAYLGASNGDAPEFFEVFEAAMAGIGITECVHVRAKVDAVASAFLDTANVILLAGGDVEAGWRAFEQANLPERIRTKWHEGAILIGVSAGAMQLGMRANDRGGASLCLFPYAIGVHAEPEWQELVTIVKEGSGAVVGIGIPTGAGAIVHPDMTVESVRKPVTQVSQHGEQLRMTEVPPTML
jgi:cyanophycinase-like exopeptidase